MPECPQRHLLIGTSAMRHPCRNFCPFVVPTVVGPKGVQCNIHILRWDSSRTVKHVWRMYYPRDAFRMHYKYCCHINIGKYIILHCVVPKQKGPVSLENQILYNNPPKCCIVLQLNESHILTWRECGRSRHDTLSPMDCESESSRSRQS